MTKSTRVRKTVLITESNLIHAQRILRTETATETVQQALEFVAFVQEVMDCLCEVNDRTVTIRRAPVA